MAFLLPALAAGAGAAAIPLGGALGDAASGGLSKLRSWLKFSKGGYVTGNRPVRAVLHPGELVLPRNMLNTVMKRRGVPVRKAPARKAPARKAPARKAPARKAPPRKAVMPRAARRR
jgi:hypothetical protein